MLPSYGEAAVPLPETTGAELVAAEQADSIAAAAAIDKSVFVFIVLPYFW